MITIANLASPDIVGWTYRAQNICRFCCADIAETVVYDNAYDVFPGMAFGVGDMENLKAWANACRVDVSAMDTYDSGEFPKPFEDCDSQEECGICLMRIFGAFERFTFQ